MSGLQDHLELVRVLVVADAGQELVGQLTGAARYRFDVQLVGGVGAALARLDAGETDVVVLQTPALDDDALDTLAQIREHAPTIAAVLVAGFVEASAAFQAIKSGVQEILPQSHLDKNLFARAVRHAVERQRLLNNLAGFEQDYASLLQVVGRLPRTLDGAADAMRVLTAGVTGMNGAQQRALKSLATHLRDARSQLDEAAGRRRRPSRPLAAMPPPEPAEAPSVAVAKPRADTSSPQVWYRQSATIPYEGDLGNFRLAEVLHFCHVGKRTGVLTLTRDGHDRTLHILRGAPVAIASTVRAESFGAHLVTTGVIDTGTRRTGVERAQQTGRRLGETLLVEGAMSPHQLHDHLRSHVRDRVVAVFGWPDGCYAFREQPRLDERIVAVAVQPERLILDGLRTHFDPSKLPQDFPADRSTTGTSLASPAYRVEQLALKPKERRVFNGLTGGRSLRRIVTDTALDPGEVMGVAYAFYVLQVIGLTDARPTELATPDAATPTNPRAAMEAAAEGAFADGRLKHYRDPQRVHDQLMDADFFTLLEISADATDEEVRKAYDAVSRRHQPRGLTDAGEIARCKLLLDRLRVAYHALCTAEGRRHYELSIKQRDRSGRRVKTMSQAERESGEGHFEIGRRLLDSQKFERAAVAFNKALQHDADNPIYYSYRGWALFQVDPRTNRRVALESLHTAMDIVPTDPMPHFFLGRIALEGQDDRVAEHHFEKALALSPGHSEAQRYLDLIDARRTERAVKRDLARPSTSTPLLFQAFLKQAQDNGGPDDAP